jgi:hypothetical protein
MTLGSTLFVVGLAAAAYCGYMERYVGDPQPDFVRIVGWSCLLVGLVAFVLGVFQGPVRRQNASQRD